MSTQFLTFSSNAVGQRAALWPGVELVIQMYIVQVYCIHVPTIKAFVYTVIYRPQRFSATCLTKDVAGKNALGRGNPDIGPSSFFDMVQLEKLDKALRKRRQPLKMGKKGRPRLTKCIGEECLFQEPVRGNHPPFQNTVYENEEEEEGEEEKQQMVVHLTKKKMMLLLVECLRSQGESSVLSLLLLKRMKIIEVLSLLGKHSDHSGATQLRRFVSMPCEEEVTSLQGLIHSIIDCPLRYSPELVLAKRFHKNERSYLEQYNSTEYWRR